MEILQLGQILQPGTGPVAALVHLRSDLDTVLWGRLPCAGDSAGLTVASGTRVTIDTLSHEGILEDRGRDPSLAYAYLSAATDFNISQVVDLVKSVHARIRVEDFR